MRRVFVDTWGWCAYIDRADEHHAQVKPFIDDLFTSNLELYTSHAVIAEPLNGIARLNVRAARGMKSPLVVLAELFRAWRRDESLEFPLGDGDDMASALGLFAKFSDHPLSYVDCLTIALCNRHRIEEIVSGDDDFDKVASGLRRLP